MSKFTPTINVAYPPNNRPLFEEWLQGKDFSGATDRQLVPVNFTSFHVNTGYGQSPTTLKILQEFVDSLDRGQKWFSVVQYDDSVLIDFKDLDVMRFEMSKNIGTPLPLMCQPQPFQFSGEKKYFASFIGSRTHPCRDKLAKYAGRPDWYISYEPHDIETYCRIISESVLTLCPRGYGLSSFRIAEAVQYGSIPIYISDEFIEPFGINFNDIGVKVLDKDADKLELLAEAPMSEWVEKAAKLPGWYKSLYSYEGCLNRITDVLQAEYNNREQD